MKAILLAVVLAAPAFGAGPYVGLRAVQPLAPDIDQAYGVMPGLELGTRLVQSDNFSFRLGLGGSYAAGLGDFGAQRLWYVGARAMEEANASPLLDAHLGIGVLYVYASERLPTADTLGSITDQWYGGSGLGVCGLGGVRLWRGGSTRLDFEAGFDLVAARTGRGEYWESWLPLSTFNVGFVLRFGEPAAVKQDARRPCTGCMQ